MKVSPATIIYKSVQVKTTALEFEDEKTKVHTEINEAKAQRLHVTI